MDRPGFITAPLHGLCTTNNAQQPHTSITPAMCCRQVDPLEMPSDDDDASSGESVSEFEDPAPPRGKAKKKPAARGTCHASDRPGLGKPIIDRSILTAHMPRLHGPSHTLSLLSACKCQRSSRLLHLQAAKRRHQRRPPTRRAAGELDVAAAEPAPPPSRRPLGLLPAADGAVQSQSSRRCI